MQKQTLLYETGSEGHLMEELIQGFTYLCLDFCGEVFVFCLDKNIVL